MYLLCFLEQGDRWKLFPSFVLLQRLRGVLEGIMSKEKGWMPLATAERCPRCQEPIGLLGDPKAGYFCTSCGWEEVPRAKRVRKTFTVVVVVRVRKRPFWTRQSRRNLGTVLILSVFPPVLTWAVAALFPISPQLIWALVGFSFIVCASWALVGWYRHTRADQFD